MNEDDILKRLDGIEHQLKLFAIAYKHLHNIFIQGVNIKLERQLLEPTLSTLNNRIYEFRQLFEELNKMVKNESIIGTLAFMAKRLHEMEGTLSQLKDEGIKKKVHLDFTIDGYEMVKRKSSITDMNDENPEDAIKQLLNTLTKRETQVLIHRYGLFGESAKTLKATGEHLSVTRERVRQLEVKALRKMRHPSRRNLLDMLTHKELKKDILGEEK